MGCLPGCRAPPRGTPRADGPDGRPAARVDPASGRQLGAALAAPSGDDRATGTGAHAEAEPVGLRTAAVVRLEGPLHCRAPGSSGVTRTPASRCTGRCRTVGPAQVAGAPAGGPAGRSGRAGAARVRTAQRYAATVEPVKRGGNLGDGGRPNRAVEHRSRGRVPPTRRVGHHPSGRLWTNELSAHPGVVSVPPPALPRPIRPRHRSRRCAREDQRSTPCGQLCGPRPPRRHGHAHGAADAQAGDRLVCRRNDARARRRPGRAERRGACHP